MLSRCFLDCSVGVGVFVTGLSQISSFFPQNEADAVRCFAQIEAVIVDKEAITLLCLS